MQENKNYVKFFYNFKFFPCIKRKVVTHKRGWLLSPTVESANFARRCNGQHGSQTLPHQTRLFRSSGTTEFNHILTISALATIRSCAGFAFLASSSSSPWITRLGFRLFAFYATLSASLIAFLYTKMKKKKKKFMKIII